MTQVSAFSSLCRPTFLQHAQHTKYSWFNAGMG